MMMATRLTLAAAFLALAAPSWAQSLSSDTSVVPIATSLYQNMPLDDQKIAHALFLAQRPVATRSAPLNLEQIAALKSDEGWSRAFGEMRARGLIQATALGDVVGRYGHQSHVAPPYTLVTTASGKVVVSSIRHANLTTNDRGTSEAAGHDEARVDASTNGGNNQVAAHDEPAAMASRTGAWANNR
jgi:hypothetical protein